MEPWELGAREAIRDAISRYAQLVDRGRLDELVMLFAPEATLEAGDLGTAQGRQAIRALFAAAGTRLGAAAARPLIRHHVTSLVIEVESRDAATAESYFLAVTGRGPDHWGRYRDRFVRSGEGWLFGHRRVRVDGRAPGSVFGR